MFEGAVFIKPIEDSAQTLYANFNETDLCVHGKK